MNITINLDDKPNLKSAMLNNTEQAKEVIQAFVSCMEEAFIDKGIKWADFPKELSTSLTFKDVVLGILKGALDVKDMNSEAYDALRIEAHPLSMLAPRKDFITGELRQRNWRGHFRQPEEQQVNEQAVSNIIRTVLRYSKYVNIKQLAEAIDTKQEMTFRGLGSRAMELLPMRPAIEYQRKHKGDLYVGTFNLDTGGLDCGEIQENNLQICPACYKEDLAQIDNHVLCLVCNASYQIKGGE